MPLRRDECRRNDPFLERDMLGEKSDPLPNEGALWKPRVDVAASMRLRDEWHRKSAPSAAASELRLPERIARTIPSSSRHMRGGAFFSALRRGALAGTGLCRRGFATTVLTMDGCLETTRWPAARRTTGPSMAVRRG